MLGNKDNKFGIVDHRDLHKNEAKHPDTFHKDKHDHSKIHEAMHLGKDKISNPLNPHRL